MNETVKSENVDFDVAVVGGGLGGLAAASLLTRGGKRVVVVEQRAHLGGRARSFTRDGFILNQGPHALYLGGPAERVLRSLEVRLDGKAPPTSGAFAERDRTLHPLPSGILSLTRTRLLDASEKLAFATFAAGMRSLRPAALANVTVEEWLATLKHERVRELVRALVRVSSYAAATDRMCAGLAVSQLQRVATKGVLYLDGGWQRLVEQLERRALESVRPVRFVHGKVRIATRDADAWTLALDADDAPRRITARDVVCAIGPAAAHQLLRDQAARKNALAEIARLEHAVPIHAATLDLGLSALPRPSHTFALGLDTPHYFSVHSPTASLTERGVVVHAARYLRPDETLSHAEVRAELEALVERVQPGYRERVLVERFSPSMLVAQWLPTATSGGLPGRPSMTSDAFPGVHFVGDWVGPHGHLLDASLHTAEAAATRILRRDLAQVA